MKISRILIASTLVLALACGKKSTEEHGHEHGPNGEHVEEGQTQEATPQEEFKVEEADTTATHTHEDGETHTDH
ncbi:hypothetical protein [Algoriphagus confluentis]|jgi:hypothetical protein|uniref:Efflux transporter periplasmic adaptor subunit n=1 Tax=Algoriphagus confluentis TaxID=1697556 RepID=A0ABQ6PJE1_9BACT|nr:hypothetical protein Aconfl_07220 [Algoriphagus confluentis]